MKHSNKELVQTLINKVFNEHDLSVLDEIMRDDYIQHNPDAAQGKKGFIEFFIPTFKAMPDFRYEIFKIFEAFTNHLCAYFPDLAAIRPVHCMVDFHSPGINHRTE